MRQRSLNFPASYLDDPAMRVGELLQNRDREARIFGRIVWIGTPRNGWVRVVVDTDDVSPSPSA